MADIQQLERALINADKAGDTQAAQAFAKEIQRLRSEQSASQANTPEASGSILPFSKMQDGSVQFDSDAGIIGALKRAVSFPGEVYRGEVSLTDPETGQVSQDAVGRAFETASVMSPVNPAVRSGSKVVPGVARNMQRQEPPVPTADELLKAGSDGFDAMRATGAQYPSSEVKQLAETLMARMNEKGFDDATASKTFRTLGKLASPPEDSFATIGNLHSARKTFGKIGQNFNDPADASAARNVVGALDEFIGGPGNQSSTAATAAQQRSGRILGEANANYAAGRRSDLVHGIERAADLRAAAANSGKNSGNAIRQRVASALLKEKDTAGFSAGEKESLEAIVEGSKFANASRDVGNLLGGGGGLGMLLSGSVGGGTGALLGGPVGGFVGGGLPIAAGMVLKSASNKATRKALQHADKQLRMRSPLFEQRLRDAPMVPVKDTGYEALIRALLLAGQSGKN